MTDAGSHGDELVIKFHGAGPEEGPVAGWGMRFCGAGPVHEVGGGSPPPPPNREERGARRGAGGDGQGSGV